ncbi:MAG TPA: hypothetical protein VFJ90_03975 [Candidatus Didemnitutus sp.]|nr:hypothetical protein [Candidatus Didemnitutus sp.]
MSSRRLLPCVVALIALLRLPAAGVVEPKPAAVGDGSEPAYELPELRVEEKPLQEFRFPTKDELQRSDFAPGTPLLTFTYPGRAYYDGVAKGYATVGLMLDPQGKVVDLIVLGYTRPYFGEALLAEARKLKYSPRRLNGVAVPAPFIFTHEFRPPVEGMSLSSFEAVDHRSETVKGGIKLRYQPCRENEVDGGSLEPLRVVVPTMPGNYPDSSKPPKVLVSFYVDEQGRVRLPNVESATTPELALRAIAAVQYWAFKPAKLKGENTLVYTYRSLTFRPETKADASNR